MRPKTRYNAAKKETSFSGQAKRVKICTENEIKHFRVNPFLSRLKLKQNKPQEAKQSR